MRQVQGDINVRQCSTAISCFQRVARAIERPTAGTDFALSYDVGADGQSAAQEARASQMPSTPPKQERLRPQFQVVHMVYTLGYLEGRSQAGAQLSLPEERRLHVLRRQLGGDPSETGPRRFRRLRTAIPALLKSGAVINPVVVLDMSAGGFRVVGATIVPLDQAIQLQASLPGEVRYHFPCRVVHITAKNGDEAAELGLAIDGTPLQIRLGSLAPLSKKASA